MLVVHPGTNASCGVMMEIVEFHVSDTNLMVLEHAKPPGADATTVVSLSWLMKGMTAKPSLPDTNCRPSNQNLASRIGTELC